MNWEKHNPDQGPYTHEDYIDTYITAEIPPLPTGQVGPLADEQRKYHQFVIEKMYHTCKVTRCKDTATDPCRKRFPARTFFCITLTKFIFQKQYSSNTLARNNMETIYRRRPPPQPGVIFDPHFHAKPYIRPASDEHPTPRQYTNSFVVPHNRFLTIEFNAQ